MAPAVSRSQQKFMAMVLAAKRGQKPASKKVAMTAHSMTEKAAEEFASTKRKGLPEHKLEAMKRRIKK